MTSVADSGFRPNKKKSLLDKFDVPVHHLDFDYVQKCADVKELEKIIKILRSKQEGYYPELEKCAENQLAGLDSRNRLLRHTTKVMTKADLSKEEWNNMTGDIRNWIGGVENKDLEIFEAKSRGTPNGALPNIRNSTKGFRNNKKSGSTNDVEKRISSLDYKSWEKFDADEECKKMDLEEEKRQSEENRKNSEAAQSNETSLSIEEVAIESLGDISHLSANEKEVMAVREKDIGNEFYNTNKIEDAIKHYSRSIHLSPTIAGLNNRAQAYIKQCAFNKALEDLNQVLEMDPKNVKARFRRAQSFQHKNMFREALEDINEVLFKEPNHLIARHIADRLRESVARLPKMHKIKIKDKETGKIVTKTVTEAEMLNDYKNENFIEVNDWGLPKIMCNCNGRHSNDPGIRHEEHMRYQHLKQSTVSKPSVKKIEKLEKLETPEPEKYAPIALPGKKLEILEVEKGSQEVENSDKDNTCVVADMRTVKPATTESNPKIELTEPSGEISHHESNQNDGKVQKHPRRRSSKTDSLGNAESKNTESGSESAVLPEIKIEKSPDLNGEKTRNTSKSKSQKSRGKKYVNDKLPNRDNSPKSQKMDTNAIIKDISDNQSSRKETPKKPSIPDRVKGDKTEKNSRIQDNQMVNGHDNRARNEHCGCLEAFDKFQFKKEWSVLTGPKSLERKAQLLKSICPKHMVRAFGNSWEKEMLVDVFLCLRNHFSPSDQNRVAEYLSVVPKLDRFKINAMFLTTEEKSLVRELIKTCQDQLDSNFLSAFSS